MDFPLYFEKVIWVGGGNFFRQIFFLKKPNTPEYAQVLVVTWAKPNSVTALLSPRPNSLLATSKAGVQVNTPGRCQSKFNS